MKPVQIMMDEHLLARLDEAARKQSQGRSALVRKCVEEHLRKRCIEDMDRQALDAYARVPQTPEEVQEWLPLQVWPEEQWRGEP